MDTLTAYVQKGTVEGYLSESCALVAQDLTRRGYTVVPFDRENLPTTVTEHTPVKGDTGAVQSIYEWTFNHPYPNVDIPEALRPLARRKVWETTLGKLRARERSLASLTPDLFVKPLKQAKAFRGGRFSYISRDLCLYPDDYPILAQKYIRFLRERRFFVGPRGVRANNHDPELRAFAERVHATWKHEAPAAYVLDVGKTNKGPAIVEINSILTAGYLDAVRDPGALLIAAWKSYVHHAKYGSFR